MKTRWKILIAVGIFLLVLAGVSFMGMRVQPEREVDAYKKLLLVHGEKLELAQVTPAQVPASENCVDAVTTAFGMIGSGGYIVPESMQMVAPGKAMATWQQPVVRDYASRNITNSWDEFATNIDSYRPAIEMLKSVFDRPKLDFELDYRKEFSLLLPQLEGLKRSAQLLSAAAVLDLHEGNAGGASTNICILLALVHADEAEPILISHLVRIAMVAIAENPTWELLQATNTTDAQLAFLQKNWEQLEFFDSAEKTFELDRVWGMDEIEKLRASPKEFAIMSGFNPFTSGSSGSSGAGWGLEALTEKPRYAIGAVMWRASWSYSDELRLLKSDTIVLETLRMMQTNQSQFYQTNYDTMTSRLSSLGITNAGAAFFRVLKIPDFGDYFGFGAGLEAVVRKTIQIETGRRIVVTAIALKRFELRHGKWPGTLTELVPKFLPSVPIDPFDGKPLRYRPNPDGTYLLYSVGEDGKDDGGNPNLAPGIRNANSYWQNPHALDWVWPQPATPAEVKVFYAHPPK